MRVIFTYTFLFLMVNVLAQKLDTAQMRPFNNVNLINLGADGSLLSINYEKLVSLNSRLYLVPSIGMGYDQELCLVLCPDNPPIYLNFSQRIGLIYGKEKFFFELGIAGLATVGLGDVKDHYYLFPFISYRFLPLKSGKINFRISFSPLSFLPTNSEYALFPTGSEREKYIYAVGIGFGRSF